MNAEIIAIGSEMLTPFRQDTNSLYLTRRLNELGVDVIHKAIVGDNRERLTEAVRQALARAEIVITMGGLGPTEDDLTRECVAEALGTELRRDHTIVAELYTRFAARRTKMPENNARQGDVLVGAEVLKNDRGTAPGQMWCGDVAGLGGGDRGPSTAPLRGSAQDDRTTTAPSHAGEAGSSTAPHEDKAGRIVILLPGPPFELEAMYELEVHERLRALVPQEFIATRELKIAMVGESAADQRAAPIYKPYEDVETTILAGAGEVQFHLKARSSSQEAAEARVEELATKLEEEFADEVFSTTGEKLEQIVGYYLQMRNATLAVAESCTGGLLAQRLTSVSGSSRYFLGGAVVYSNDLKTALADVPPLMIVENGAVSKPVAIALAEGIRKKCRSTLGVGITGVAGPTGGTDEKPVGLVYIAVTDGKKTDVVQHKFPGDRDRIRMWAAQQALDMIRRRLI